jgi:hypothetical protein
MISALVAMVSALVAMISALAVMSSALVAMTAGGLNDAITRVGQRALQRVH